MEVGETRKSASFLLIMPWSTRSKAIFNEALAVRLPSLVCKIYNFPFSMVNSMSCMSL